MILLFILMAATAIVMIVGVVLMTKGGALNEKYGNKLMIARVGLQALSLGMLGLLVLMK